MIRVGHPMFGGGECDGAMDPIRFHRKSRPRSKLIGQRPLNQLSALTRARIRGWHLHAGFLPIEMKPWWVTFSRGSQPPSDCEMPSWLLKGTMFDCVGDQLVQDHRKGLDCAGAQRNTFWPVERDRSIFSHTNGVRGQLGIEQFVERDPAAFLHAKEEPLRAG